MAMTTLKEIAKRAALIKADPNLRHTPNKHDLKVASEHAKLMLNPQYQTLKDERQANDDKS